MDDITIPQPPRGVRVDAYNHSGEHIGVVTGMLDPRGRELPIRVGTLCTHTLRVVSGDWIGFYEPRGIKLRWTIVESVKEPEPFLASLCQQSCDDSNCALHGCMHAVYLEDALMMGARA